jgi:hypothetical protein
MSIGPVEYMVVAFPGNQFKGEIAPALRDLVDEGTIRILDLAIVTKDSDGNVVAMEVEQSDAKAFAALESMASDRGGLITASDLEAVGEALDDNSSAAMLVWEDVWATRLKDALQGAGGVLVEIRRVPSEAIEAAMEWNAEHADEFEGEAAAV